jgi:hypothetical protein
MSRFDFIGYQRLDHVSGQQTRDLQPKQITVASRAVHVDQYDEGHPIVDRHTPTFVFYFNKTDAALSGGFAQQMPSVTGRFALNSNGGLSQIHLIASIFIVGDAIASASDPLVLNHRG